MVEFIRAENIKALVTHLVEKFGSQLEEVDYVDTFRALRLKYDQVSTSHHTASDPLLVLAGCLTVHELEESVQTPAAECTAPSLSATPQRVGQPLFELR